MVYILKERNNIDQSKRRNDVLEYSIIAASLYFIYLSNFYSFLLFHSISELFSIIIAGGIFVIGWNSRKYMHNSFFLVIGVSSLFTGGIDLIHTLAYKGMGVFLEYDSNLPTQLWITARYIQAFSLLLATLVINKKIKTHYLFLGYSVITFAVLFSVFLRTFPVCYIEGVGLTPFKIISEYIIDAIFFVSLLVLYKFKKEFNKKTLILMVISIIATMISELAFTFYVSVYGLLNIIGHVFKIIANFFAYKAIIETGLENPFNLLFRELNASEKKYRKIIEDSIEGVWIIDSDARTVLVNQSMANILGYTISEMMGKSLFMFMDDKGIEIAKEKFERRKRGIEEEHEFEFLHKSGRKVYTLLKTNPIHDDNGNFSGAMAFATDITERKSAQEKIASIARFPSENPYPVLRVDKEIVIYANKVGKDIFNINEGSKEPEILHDMINKAIDEKVIKELEIQMNNRFYSLVITPFEDKTYVNVYGMDITKRKKAEQNLEQFISTASHELRTPITVLIQTLDLLNHYGDKLSEEQKEDINKAFSRNIYLLAELVEDLLTISKIDEDRIKLEMRKFLPLNTVHEILELLEPKRKAKNITIDVDIDNNIQLMGDNQKISQVFRIIIDNAIKYSNENSTIYIKAIDHYTGKYNGKGVDCTLFQFIDSGIGIREEDIPKLFQRFFRAEEVREIPGTGLGLSIARELVRIHKGEIYVESTHGKGSTLSVFLPK